MFPPRLLKSINLTLAVAMLLQPILAAVPTPVAHAAPGPRVGGEPAPLVATGPAYPAAAPAEPLAAYVPVDKAAPKA